MVSVMLSGVNFPLQSYESKLLSHCLTLRETMRFPDVALLTRLGRPEGFPRKPESATSSEEDSPLDEYSKTRWTIFTDPREENSEAVIDPRTEYCAG